MTTQEKKIGMLGMTGLIVSSVIGGGIFNLMSDMAKSASVATTTIAMVLSGIGMGLFVFCLQHLNAKLPELNAGICSYAEHSYGSFAGFNSAFGYWCSLFLGNVAFGTFVFSALGAFFPIFGDGQTISAVIGASVVLWTMHVLILRGSSFASKINGIITVAKLVPLAIFIVAMVVAFDYELFSSNVWGTISGQFEWAAFNEQLTGSMASVVWVFVGVEGAVVYSARAKSHRIVGKATVISFALITAIYLLATVLSFAVMSQPELAELGKPAMAYVLERAVGPWGAMLINIGVIVSVLGAWLACTMFAGEILFQSAKDGVFPKVFAVENAHKAPANALLLSNGLVQFFLLSLLINQSAYNFMALLASSTMLIPYFFVAMAQFKLSRQWAQGRWTRDVWLGLLAAVYLAYCMVATGWAYILLTSLLLAPGMVLYVVSRKQAGQTVFMPVEKIGAVAMVVLAIVTVVCLLTGAIDLATI